MTLIINLIIEKLYQTKNLIIDKLVTNSYYE